MTYSTARVILGPQHCHTCGSQNYTEVTVYDLAPAKMQETILEMFPFPCLTDKPNQYFLLL